MQINLVIVENDKRLRQALELLLENSKDIRLSGIYGSAKDAIEGIRNNNPKIVLIDLNLIDLSGIEVIKTINKERYKTEFLVLSKFNDSENLIYAIKAGAVGYISKSDLSYQEIITTVKKTVKGEASMSLNIAKKILDEVREDRAILNTKQKLCKEEIDILVYISKGYSTKSIADKLTTSDENIRYHQKNIYKKLHTNFTL